MTVYQTSSQMLSARFGVRVQRAAADLPQTASTAYFTVTGGDVYLTGIYGQVTTLIVAAVNLNLTYTPSGGSAADLCAATTCDDDAVGTLYSLTTGVAADKLAVQTVTGSEVPNVTFTQGLRQPIILRAGALNLKASASRVGQTKWTLTYIPIDDGATVAAA